MNTLDKYGINIPQILLPKDKKNLKQWATIACDQYTQDRDYWKKVQDETQGKPSTLNITLPEVYLQDTDKPQRIKNIQSTMKEYLQNDVFDSEINGMVYIERTTGYGRVRKGLVTAIDLETYEWKPFSNALIRATEATIIERIPPRMEIRKGAALETPHIMLLVNDFDKLLVEKTGENAKANTPIYDTDLMLKSGHITGWQVSTEKQLIQVEEALSNIAKKNTDKNGSVFMFAVGDGNHSLATAKAVWNEFKEKNGNIENHPARYALIEIVNIYDEGLTFEPIHRVLFNIDSSALLEKLSKEFSGTVKQYSTAEELEKDVKNSKANFGFVFDEDGKTVYKCLQTDIQDLAVSKLQPALDTFLKDAPDMHVCNGDSCSMCKPEIDYIHGTEEVFRLGGKNNACSILLPPIEKNSFFSTIAGSGPLPRKSFSMGEASEKRFYMECRKLF